MALIEWSDEYSVGVAEMDKQHKKLVAMINDLHDAMKSGRGKDSIDKILSELVEYSSTHFMAEETLMKTYGFPGYELQKECHAELTSKVLDLQNKFRDRQAVLTVELMSFLKEWLIVHIQGMDKKYGPFLRSKGIL